MNQNTYLYPNWPAAKNVHAAMTLKSEALNLSRQAIIDTAINQKLHKDLVLPSLPIWLTQEHGNQVVELFTNTANFQLADASITMQTGVVCTVLTADCLPILICDRLGKIVAAIHAGWRSQVAGIIENTIKKMQLSYQKLKLADLILWFGPAISGEVYEVGLDVYKPFKQAYGEELVNLVFKEKISGKAQEPKWLLDLYLSARIICQRLGINKQQIFGGNWCTYTENQKFYSYRRDNTIGRMASLIWLD